MAVREFTGQLDEEYSAPRVREFTGKLDGEVEPQKGPIQAAEDAPDFSRGMGNIIPQIKSTYGAAKALTGVVAQKLGFEDTGRGIMQSGLETMEKGEAESIVKPTDELIGAWEKGGAGAILTDWLPYQMGAGVGNLAQTLGFMAIGAVTGAGVASIPGAVAGAVGRNLIKDGIIAEAQALAKKGATTEAKDLVEAAAKKEVSALARGATAGMVTQSAMQGLGEVGGRAFQEGENRGERPEDVDLARVLPMAGVHAIADFVADKIMLGAFKPITKEVKNGLTLEIGKRILTTGTKELLPEEVQTIAERFGAKLSLTDAGAIRDYINTAGASYAMSVIPGGVGAIRSKLASPVSGDKPKTTEDPLVKTGETTTEAGTETELPLFTPVELPDGTVARSQADLDAYNQNPTAPVGATSASVDALTAEIATMEAKYAKREDDIKNGPKNAVPARIKKNADLKKEIEAKKAELAAATTAPAATPAPSADVDGTNLTPGANGQVTPPAAPVPPAATTTPAAQTVTPTVQEQQEALNQVIANLDIKSKIEAALNPNQPVETPAREYTAPEQAAVDLVKAVDAGGVPTDTRKINKIARDLGLEVSTKAKPEETLNRIKEAVGRIDTTQAETSVAPVATEVVKEAPKQQAPLPTARAATPEEQNAINHIDAVDAKGAKFSPAQARKVAQAVGIQIPKATKEKPVTTEDINQIIRNYVGNLEGVLAGRIRQIAPNVFEGTATTATKKVEERVTPREKDNSEDIERAAIQQGFQQNKNEEVALNQTLKETESQKLPKVATPDIENFQDEYNLARQELAAQEEPIKLPEWSNLDSDEKDFFLSKLPSNPSAADYTTALKELADYKEEQGRGAGYGQEKVTPTEQRIINGYNEARN